MTLKRLSWIVWVLMSIPAVWYGFFWGLLGQPKLPVIYPELRIAVLIAIFVLIFIWVVLWRALEQYSSKKARELSDFLVSLDFLFTPSCGLFGLAAGAFIRVVFGLPWASWGLKLCFWIWCNVIGCS